MCSKISKKRMELNWSPKSPIWSEEQKTLLVNIKKDQPNVALSTLLQKSEEFPIKFPTDTPRCKTLQNLVPAATLERNINSAYVLIHENILELYTKFILLKRKFGNKVEKLVYDNINLVQFIDRLLTKRAATFMGKNDRFLLINGKKGHSAWESIGTLKESKGLALQDCLSYEEIKLSAFMSVSSYTHFVNKGDRKNMAIYETNRSGIQDEGIIVGIIGPRLIKTGVMDYQELVISEEQNTTSNGYGSNISNPTIHQLFGDLYRDETVTYEEAVERMKSPENKFRYLSLKGGEILDSLSYYKRVIFSIDLLLLEANARAKLKGTTAYIHVVGIGLGVWKKSEHQNKIFMDTCAQRIKALGSKLSHVSDICFAYIKHTSCGRYKHNELVPILSHPLKGIKVYLSNRNPHEKLTGNDSKKLLVVSFAWDGNALPGNEFWMGKLASSGDSAAASSTQITELHNPFINSKVDCGNLYIVTNEGEVKHLSSYVESSSFRKRSHTSL